VIEDTTTMPVPHRWDLPYAEARDLQRELASEIDTSTPLPEINLIAAADVSFNRFDTEIAAAVVVVRVGTFELVERVGLIWPMAFPYIPGLLSFREGPALVEAFGRIQSPYDVILMDGQGIAHPRRIGIASHLGLFLDRPSVGCAKTRLTGKYEEPGPNRGDRTPLLDGDEVIGAVVRTKDRVKPLFVSPGHRCDLESAVGLVLATSGKYRLPTPTRMVHDFVNEVRRRAKGLIPPEP
jgi:deoxyribonuclease V